MKRVEFAWPFLAALGVVARAEPIHHYDRLVANHPSVVAARERGDLAGPRDELASGFGHGGARIHEPEVEELVVAHRADVLGRLLENRSNL